VTTEIFKIPVEKALDYIILIFQGEGNNPYILGRREYTLPVWQGIVSSFSRLLVRRPQESEVFLYREVGAIDRCFS
jgi:hypothetical protein